MLRGQTMMEVWKVLGRNTRFRVRVNLTLMKAYLVRHRTIRLRRQSYTII
jgi:hypothetical protein